MALQLNTDTGSMFTVGNMRDSQQQLASSLAKISSGRQINRAADDAAGMQIANMLSSQSRGYGQEIRNVADSMAATQVADGALQEGGAILQDIREKALQAANAGQSEQSRQAIQAEVNEQITAYNQIIDTTTFNNQQVLPAELRLSAGAEGEGSLQVTTREGAQAAVERLDTALGDLNAARGDHGARQQQLTSELASLATANLNTRAAESQIADTDLAEEAMVMSQMNTLRQAQTFALAQGMALNKSNALNLLQGD
ncbi:MAG: flagellin [Desulfurivibrio sp.]|nr:flagellin [Desulfurivibrio sp.]